MLAAHKRKTVYLLIKGGKQKFVWKNFLRTFMTAYQPIMFMCTLNLSKASLAKPILAVSTILAGIVWTVMMIAVCLLGSTLYRIQRENFKTEKLYKKQVRMYFEGIMKPFKPESGARMLKWWDSFLKKGMMIAITVFFYELPPVAIGLLTLLG
jgi:hypothetical protein